MEKRIFDFLAALAFLVIIVPVVPFIAVWIKATSSGPIIFRQVRLGYRGAPFTMFKFRTMEDKTWQPFDVVLSGDDRVTEPGRFLRKTHLDELPQLVNVLLGQMSMVGPRPLQAEIIEKRIQEVSAYAHRLDIRPGLTGLEQIQGRMWSLRRGIRCGLRLDIFYISHHCIWLDLRILCRTVSTVLRCKGI